ncbi:MAG: hypothetical protein ACK5MT_00975 [Actinomycetales bacterium]
MSEGQPRRGPDFVPPPSDPAGDDGPRAPTPSPRPRRLGWGLLALTVYVAVLLPQAVLWSVEARRFGAPGESTVPVWTPDANYWSYDSLLWSTTILAAAMATLAVRRRIALAGIGGGVVFGVAGDVGAQPALASVVAVATAAVVALGVCALTLAVSRWWWGRLITLVCCVPLVADQVRLLDLAYGVTGLPRPTLPPSATVLGALVAASAVVVVGVCSGLEWFGGGLGRWPISVVAGVLGGYAAYLLLTPVRFALMDLAALALSSWAPDPGRASRAGASWGYVPAYLAMWWWVFLPATALAIGCGCGVWWVSRQARAAP